MMVERGDRTVLHEPFSHVADFGSTIVDGVEVTDERTLIAAIHALGERTPVFFKDTTDFRYPALLADEGFLAGATHTFMIRHPAEAIASHAALNPRLERDEIGFARLAEIYDAVAAVTGAAPVVLDSDDLVERPAATVRCYCARVGIPFLADALAWEPGLRAEWEKTSRWHESTSRTSGFVRTRPRDRDQEPDRIRTDPVLAGYLAYHLPYYQRLQQRRLRPDC
jgi:hypothetical protein